MKRNDTTFKEMVARISSGELTRRQAADTYQLNYGTLCVWLGRSGLNDATKAREPRSPRVPRGQRYGAAKDWPTLSTQARQALEDAAARVLAGESTLQKEAIKNPLVKTNTLAVLVRRKRDGATPSAAELDHQLILEVLKDPDRVARVAAVIRAANL